MTQADLAIFVAGCGTLLFMPGPTNAVMMASGAASGFRRSVPITLVALAGYGFSIIILLAVSSLIGVYGKDTSLALKAIGAVAMMIVSLKLWAGANSSGKTSSGAGSVLSLTLLNPKALILAFGIIPPIGSASELAVKCAILAVVVVLSATCWIALGAVMKTLSASSGTLVAKVASVVVGCFAVYLLMSAIGGVELTHVGPSITT